MPETADLEALLRCGQRLDAPVAGGGTLCDLLIASLLRVRDKQGRLVPLRPNRAQREYARLATRRNLVLKARQLGITTYVAARFFVQTITRPGTLTVQVAHDQRSAEEIFRIVHRFLENLPEISYNAGLAVLPDAVKVACAQIARNALATPALTLKAGTLDRMHLEYFASTLLDGDVVAMLAPFVAQKVA
jgi:hypothetical protein